MVYGTAGQVKYRRVQIGCRSRAGCCPRRCSSVETSDDGHL